jgi:hypothetical protein
LEDLRTLNLGVGRGGNIPYGKLAPVAAKAGPMGCTRLATSLNGTETKEIDAVKLEGKSGQREYPAEEPKDLQEEAGPGGQLLSFPSFQMRRFLDDGPKG